MAPPLTGRSKYFLVGLEGNAVLGGAVRTGEAKAFSNLFSALDSFRPYSDLVILENTERSVSVVLEIRRGSIVCACTGEILDAIDGLE